MPATAMPTGASKDRAAGRGRPRATMPTLCAVLIAAGLTPGAPLPAQSLPADAEFEIKASFIYTLAKFVTWPARAFPRPESPLVFCASDADPLGDALERLVRGRSIGGRAVAFERIGPGQTADLCHVLVAGLGVDRLADLLARSRRASVLTVGENDEFAAMGGIVRLKMSEGMVQAEVNDESARRAGLQISAKFLKLSGIVTVSTRTAVR